MANSSPRLSTAELRRRLQAPAGVPAPIAPPEPTPAPPAAAPPPRAAAPRFTLPANIPDLPVEDDATVAFADLAHQPMAPAPVPVKSRAPTPAPQPRPVPQIPTRGSNPRVSRPVLPDVYAEPAPIIPAQAPVAYADPLHQENEQLQGLLDEMRQLLQEASDQEQKTQKSLTERDIQLAEAVAKIKALEEIIALKPKTRGELEEWADELERDNAKLEQQRRAMDEDRKQLREDEAALEKQMREMEVQMARERAMLARQEQELRRLNAEIQHELESMQRGDGVLRDRLQVFQRRHAEVVGSEVPMAEPITPGPRGTYGPVPTAQAAAAPPPAKKSDSTGLLRKIFRGDKS
jgi:hypothetical protein